MADATGASLLLVDDDPQLLRSLHDWLSQARFRVRTAADGWQALELIAQEVPQLVITDLQMPGMGGLDLLDHLREHYPGMPVVILSGQATLDDAIAALRQGRAFDMLKKPLPRLGMLREVIEAALRNGIQASARPPSAPDEAGNLSPREQEIADLLCQGLSNQEIATLLCLSEKTVRNQMSVLYSKLGVDNRLQALLRLQRVSDTP